MSDVRIVLAVHDAPTRAGLRLALRAPGLLATAEAADAEGLLALARAQQFDVALVAADLPGGGLVAVRALSREAPSARTILISRQTSDEEFLEAVRAGAVGYLGQGIQADRLAAVVRAAAAGEAVVPRCFAASLLDEIHGRERLRSTVTRHASRPVTEREWEVLRLLAEDLSTAQLAQRIGISEVTVRRHVSSALAKLGVPDRKAAVCLLRSKLEREVDR